MKLRVLKDRNDNIVASFEATTGGEINLEPQVSEDQKIEEIDVPEDYASRPHVLYEQRST
jgi:hypothetical protein